MVKIVAGMIDFCQNPEKSYRFVIKHFIITTFAAEKQISNINLI
jgi:hypothetical protein